MTARKRRHTSKDIWARADAEWRDPAEVVSQWRAARNINPRLLKWKASGDWWNILAAGGMTLLVTREYEHVLMALRADEKGAAISYLPLPHPSGIAIDRRRKIVHVASTRNPNQILDLKPVAQSEQFKSPASSQRFLIPVRTRFLPGRLYLHDLALIDGELYATAVGENAIVHVSDDGRYQRVWWPRAIENPKGPRFDQNYLQLNSIAAGTKLSDSFFSASTDQISVRRPGHQNFPVDKRGVIFSGVTREPIVRGLTRPHSARLYNKRLWVNNSGYGELCVVNGAGFDTVARLPGWTRGLCFHKGIAFVGTSRVIPRFRQYAPGLSTDKSMCGVYALDILSGQVLGSLTWPDGNQIFAVDWVVASFALGLPFAAASRNQTMTQAQQLFYDFQTE